MTIRIVGLGHGLFAIAAAGLAALSLFYRDFAPMWHSVPAWLPGQTDWVVVSALLLLAASVGLVVSRTALPSALTLSAYYAAWAVTGVPAIVADPHSLGSWYGFSEALTALAGAWILVMVFRANSHGPRAPVAGVRAALGMFGLTCVFYGSSHFAYADYTASMVPAWLPGRSGLAYFTGLSYIAAGISIIAGPLQRLAAFLVAIMVSLFGLLVWVPSFFTTPRPAWATPPQNQWSELAVTLLLAASAWVVADVSSGMILDQKSQRSF